MSTATRTCEQLLYHYKLSRHVVQQDVCLHVRMYVCVYKIYPLPRGSKTAAYSEEDHCLSEVKEVSTFTKARVFARVRGLLRIFIGSFTYIHRLILVLDHTGISDIAL